MKLKAALLVGVAALIAAATPAVAHHSFAAEYDATRPVVINGVVTRIEWTNPHAHCYLDVTDGTGTIANWCAELAPPKALIGCGWRHDTVAVGDHLTIDGALAKDGSRRLNARLVTLADGRVLSAGSSGGDVPPSR